MVYLWWIFPMFIRCHSTSRVNMDDTFLLSHTVQLNNYWWNYRDFVAEYSHFVLVGNIDWSIFQICSMLIQRLGTLMSHWNLGNIMEYHCTYSSCFIPLIVINCEYGEYSYIYILIIIDELWLQYYWENKLSPRGAKLVNITPRTMVYGRYLSN